MEPLELRPMTSGDLPALEPLWSSRNVHRREYERFVGLEGASGVVLQGEEGRLVGAITTLRYFEHAMLGPPMLSPGEEGVGISLALVGSAVERLQRGGATRIEAEATLDEAVLLENMGFRRARRTLVLERSPGASPEPSGRTRAMRASDLLDVGALDATAIGHGRKQYFLELLREDPEGARVVEEGGEVVAFSFRRRARRGYHLGPLVSREGEAEMAGWLLGDTLGPISTWPVVALAPEGDAASVAMRRGGFEQVGELVRMRAGRLDVAPGAATEWLVGGRITG